MNEFIDLRKYKVLHRDLKIQNLFLHNNILLIGDFGMAKKGKEITSTKVGTPLTMALKLLFGEYETKYNSQSDLWSIGCIYYYFLFGQNPFIGSNLNDLKNDITAKMKRKLKLSKKVSSNCADLLNRLLCTDPLKRLKWEEFFKHPLFDPVDQQLERGRLNIIKLSECLNASIKLVEKQFMEKRKQ